ncbi:concanavalin A-like lectin/glucanase domain-containing protein [Coniochaeta sp. 2T2.1]|nr:concanavalin A-like lectin/glucanase domain-containing protein [Coniochaeta sp. 2T2.1]
MSQRRTDDWGDDDDWGMPAGGGTGAGPQQKSGHGMNNIIHNQTEYGHDNNNNNRYGYGPVDNSYNNNFDDFPIGGGVQAPGAYNSNDRLPPRANMDYGSSEKYGTPWYKKKLTWGIAALVIIVAIVVPVAVVVTRNKNHGNAYPDYTALNYTLLETYSGETFFDKFDYYTGYDPAHGFVHYVPRETAKSLNLTYATSTSATLKVDTSVTNASVPNASTGRFSVRIESKQTYEVGTLFLFDVLHSPYGCGTWPALWLSDPDPSTWPANGEIDVFEAINAGDRGNTVSLHTTKDCDMSDVKRLMTGKAGQGDCYNGTNSNTGCGVEATSVSSYGAGFNSAGGGVMAVELREAGIRVWSWLRSAVPADVKAATAPNPGSWGEAFADFPSTDCDIGAHFRNQSIIANIDLCGDLVEATWDDSGCESLLCP